MKDNSLLKNQMMRKIIEQMAGLEKNLADLFQELQPKVAELNKATELVEKGRSNLVDLILGPQFFGNGEFFRAYRFIHRCGTGRQAYGCDKDRLDFDRTYYYGEGEGYQILLRVNFQLLNKGHYHTALVRNGDKGNVNVYEAPVAIGRFDVPNPSFTWKLKPEWITKSMIHYSLDKLVKYDPKDKYQMIYNSFLRAIVGATELLLDSEIFTKKQKKAIELYQAVERNMAKLRAVADLEMK